MAKAKSNIKTPPAKTQNAKQSPLQLLHLHTHPDRLQKIYGNPKLQAIHGAGQTSNPKILLLFMNPTGRNVASAPDWPGLKAPWLGTKNIWKLLHSLKLISAKNFQLTQSLKAQDWTPPIANQIYSELQQNSVYITNLAKCTQPDARALKDKIFKAYLEHTLEEIKTINPQTIISFGNQVSSILLGRGIQVMSYQDLQSETLQIGTKHYRVFPVCYPVGQGMRNLPKAIERIKRIISTNKVIK